RARAQPDGRSERRSAHLTPGAIANRARLPDQPFSNHQTGSMQRQNEVGACEGTVRAAVHLALALKDIDLVRAASSAEQGRKRLYYCISERIVSTVSKESFLHFG